MKDPARNTGIFEEGRPSGEPVPEGDTPPSRRHDPYEAVRSANYRNFASGFLFSSTGLQMLATAIAWEVYERTDSALSLGLIGLARAVPVLLLALPAGHLADIFDRRKLLIATQFAFALSAGGLAAASYHEAPMWVLYALLVLTGCVRSLNGPTRSSLLPLIVPAKAFHNAVTWNSGVFQTSAIGGPLLAGAIIAVTHTAWPVYVLTALGCLIFAVSGTFIRPRERPRANGRPSGKFTPSAMLAGMGHVWREKTVLSAITLDLFAVLLGGATALMPIFAKDILGVGPVGLGMLRAAPYVGALAMAVVIAYLPPFKRSGRALLWSVAGFGVATIAFGFSQWFPLSLALLVVAGALDNISVVVRHVLVQVRTPDEMRGRVSAVNSLFIESSNELGALRAGVMAEWLGPVLSVGAGGVGTVVVVAGVAWLWPEIRRLGRLELADEEPAPAAPVTPPAAGPVAT